MTSATISSYDIKWEKLPDDFILPDDPVDNIHQPALAAALTDSLEIAGKVPENAVTTTNYGICATINDKIVIKAPDWAYIPLIRVPKAEINRSYTPQLQGEPPIVVGELLLWGAELVIQERQKVEAEQQKAEVERQKAERLAAQLRAAGIEPEL